MGSKDSKSRRTSKLQDQSTKDNEGVSRRRYVAVGVSDRWKVTFDTADT